jgi:hypothetical protein
LGGAAILTNQLIFPDLRSLSLFVEIPRMLTVVVAHYGCPPVLPVLDCNILRVMSDEKRSDSTE